MTDAQRQRVFELHSQGLGYSKIAQATGISINTIKSSLQRATQRSTQAIKVVAGKPQPSPSAYCKQCKRLLVYTPGHKKKQGYAAPHMPCALVYGRVYGKQHGQRNALRAGKTCRLTSGRFTAIISKTVRLRHWEMNMPDADRFTNGYPQMRITGPKKRSPP